MIRLTQKAPCFSPQPEVKYPKPEHEKSPSDQTTAVLLHLVKKGSLTTCKITDSVRAHGIKRGKGTLPVADESISDGIVFSSMLPMAKRLAFSMDNDNFDYKEEIPTDYK